MAFPEWTENDREKAVEWKLKNDEYMRKNKISYHHLNQIMYVERHKNLFLETGNPLYAWRAFENARRMGFDIPEEVLDHIADVAHEIVSVAQDPPTPAQRPVALAKALKLHKKGRGQGSHFTDYRNRLKDRALALRVVDNEYYEPDLLDYAFDDVAQKSGRSKSTVRRIFLSYKKKWQTMAQQLIESGAVQKEPNGWKIEIQNYGTADDHREVVEILKEIIRS